MSKNERKRSDAMRIFEALSEVDEELLARSEEEQKSKIVRWQSRRIPAAGALVAAVCVVVIGTAMWQAGGPMFTAKESTAENSAYADSSLKDAVFESEIETGNTDGGLNGAEMAMDSADNAEPESPAEDAESAMQEAGAAKTDSKTTDNIGLRDVTEEEAGEIAVLGEYVPTVIPAGYVWEEAKVHENPETGEVERLFVIWRKGSRNFGIEISKMTISKEQIADVEDLKADEKPIIAEQDFSLDMVEACMKSAADADDKEYFEGEFSVLYETGVLVRFMGNGTPTQIWEMFQSIP